MKRLLATGFLGMAITACGGAGTATSSTEPALEGTSWQLVSIDGREPDVEVTPTLVIAEDGRVSGTAVCNTYMGQATIEGSSISVGPLATTRIACSGAAGLLEQAFLGAMDEVEAFAIDSSGRLVLEDGVVLVFEPAPAAS
jgi:putative lipoprotein